MKEANKPRRKRAVQQRARKIMKKNGWGYGKAMKRAGWEVKRLLGER